MLEVEWSGGEDFTEDLGEEIVNRESEPTEGSTFHGTIDLICSSDEDYDSELPKIERLSLDPPQTAETQAEDTKVDPEVIDVVNGLVNFVERSLLFPEFGEDPDDHRLKEEMIVKREGACNKPHCFKGCLCSSLNGRFPHGPSHCGRERCMFDCACQEKGLLTIDDENHYTDKSKRKKKLPTRFKDVVLGKAYEKLHARSIHEDFNGNNDLLDSDDECHRMTEKLTKSPSGGASKNPSPELKKDVAPPTSDFVCPLKKKDPVVSFDKASIATVRRTIQERRAGFLSRTLDEEQTLADVHIWCTQHDKFSCLCINYVFFQKTNALIWKPSNASRYLANKVMYDITLKMPTLAFYEVYPYNHNHHSARTHGPIANYALRNKDEVFQSKRKMELENNVLSYSNSYMKFYVRKYPCIKKNESVPSAEPYDKTLDAEGGMGEIVRMIKTKEKLILKVGKEKSVVKVNYAIDDMELDEDDDDENGVGKEKNKVARRKRKPTMKMIQLEEERKREKELLELEWAEKEAAAKTETPPAPAPVQEKKKRRGRKPKNLVMMERRASELSDRSTIREPTPEVDIIRCSGGSNATGTVVKSVDDVKAEMTAKSDESIVPAIKEEPSSPDYFSAESRMDMEDAKEEAIVCAPDIGLVASCAPSRTTASNLVTTAPSVVPSASKAEKDRQDEEFREDIPKPFLGFSDGSENPEFEECEDPDNDDPDSIHSKKILILKPRKDGYPHSGLMCLTPGIGYVTVLENLPGRIVICDPGVPELRQTFDNLNSVNYWLNTYIRGKVSVSPPDLVLQWILVKPGILKLKQVKPLDPALFWNSTVVITPNGIVEKKTLDKPKTSDCSELRKQLNEYSVFSPLIRTQLAMKKAATTLLQNFVSNPKFYSSNMVPNPKSVLRELLKRQLPAKEKSDEAPPPKVPAVGDSSVSFETADGCVTVHRLSSVDSDAPVADKKRQTPSSAEAKRHVPIAYSSPLFSHIRSHSALPRLLPASGAPAANRPPSDLEPRHQVTIRPLPNLTKISPPYLTNKHHSVKIHK